MTLTLEDLDGEYRVTSMSDYSGPIPMKSDGITVIKDGKTSRVDASGCKWETVITILNDDEVEFASTADPSEAKPDFCLTAADGTLTRDPVTYTTIMKVSRKENRIRLSGQVTHGKITTVITMTKG